MDLAEFDQLFDGFEHYAFRLETLPVYRVDEEAHFLDSYLSGDPLPPDGHGQEWAEFVRNCEANSKYVERVHLLPPVLTPYLRYEIEWGYTYGAAAGERIFLLLPDAPAEVLEVATEDFWLFDGDEGVRMLYESDGQFVGVEKIPEPDLERARQVRELVLQASIPLRTYLAGFRSS